MNNADIRLEKGERSVDLILFCGGLCGTLV